MLRVSEDVWEKLMRMKLDLKKSSIDDLLSEILKVKEAQENKKDTEEKPKEKTLAAA
jgi:predicted CopG family antitoxin